jgi:hypothetical protein
MQVFADLTASGGVKALPKFLPRVVVERAFCVCVPVAAPVKQCELSEGERLWRDREHKLHAVLWEFVCLHLISCVVL